MAFTDIFGVQQFSFSVTERVLKVKYLFLAVISTISFDILLKPLHSDLILKEEMCVTGFVIVSWMLFDVLSK